MPRHDDERAEDEDELGLLVDSRDASELDEQDSQRSTLFTVCPFILGMAPFAGLYGRVC